MKRYAILFTEVLQNGLLIGAGRVLAERPDAAIGVAANIMVGKELDHRRRYHIQKGFDLDFFPFGQRRFNFFLHQYGSSSLFSS